MICLQQAIHAPVLTEFMHTIVAIARMKVPDIGYIPASPDPIFSLSYLPPNDAR
jgi:hypothetical protein